MEVSITFNLGTDDDVKRLFADIAEFFTRASLNDERLANIEREVKRINMSTDKILQDTERVAAALEDIASDLNTQGQELRALQAELEQAHQNQQTVDLSAVSQRLATLADRAEQIAAIVVAPVVESPGNPAPPANNPPPADAADTAPLSPAAPVDTEAPATVTGDTETSGVIVTDPDKMPQPFNP